MKTVWFYGRSGAGKTTLARALHTICLRHGRPALLLDGDELRHGLCHDLGFTSDARIENHRRIAEVARLAAAQGIQPIAATMAPQHVQRDTVTSVLGESLTWVLVHAPLELCMARDPKGLYRRARDGAVPLLMDFPFDAPRPHEDGLTIDTAALPPEAAEQTVARVARALGLICG